jgi:hypothetical protein
MPGDAVHYLGETAAQKRRGVKAVLARVLAEPRRK